MRAQPRDRCRDGAIREKINNAVRFEVHDDRAIGLALAQGKVIQADDAHGTTGRRGRGPHQAEKRPGTDPQPLRARVPFARFPAKREAQLFEPRPQAVGALGPGGNQRGQAFGEDLPPTPAHPTDKAASPQVQTNSCRPAWQISDGAAIVGMHPL